MPRRRAAVPTAATPTTPANHPPARAGTMRMKPEASNGTGVGGLFGTLTKGLGTSKAQQAGSRKDARTVFVAGATGRLGVRIIR